MRLGTSAGRSELGWKQNEIKGVSIKTCSEEGGRRERKKSPPLYFIFFCVKLGVRAGVSSSEGVRLWLVGGGVLFHSALSVSAVTLNREERGGGDETEPFGNEGRPCRLPGAQRGQAAK